MENKAFISAIVLLMATGCGGGGGGLTSPPPEPPPPAPSPAPEPPAAMKLEIFTGKATVDFDQCRSTDGTVATAAYSQLQRATASQDAVYLAETGEGCTNVAYEFSNFEPSNLPPSIRKVSGGVVQTAIRLNSYFTAMSHPAMVRYPSGIYRQPDSGELFVLSYVAASSEYGFTLNENEVARYTAKDGWTYYPPGLFKFTQEQTMAGYNDLVAGTVGRPPRLADGQGLGAGFYAPHDLEVDASGRFYLIDQGRIRTIDANKQVTTLDNTALGIKGTVQALDADRQGRIHALVKRGYQSYSWHRLADGTKVDFRTGIFVGTGFLTFETFAVVGDDLLLGVRDTGYSFKEARTQLYRVSANGTVTKLTGEKTPTTPQDFLDNPVQYLLPNVQHIEYGPDGHLYIVLPQGVLRARNFK